MVDMGCILIRVFLTIGDSTEGDPEIVEAEPDTLYWYAVEFPGTNKFGIVDFFPDESGRGAHVAGKVAAAWIQALLQKLIGIG
ncbi:hypothetical protein GYMLUDRAFT_50663 [Collybiopsis luxurians FD-317 M1]|uniref:Uncharacterized protein n=1 Tax=Collybiopsis luxurians FD-317 M1 TaxID=944289 RepID=A0A0D0AM20_9AGAR|nr:hypothetical protein GYMLUDRAFT_50663 [Collybiopsis luxurians FD-317 M1]